ncbi:MAG: glutamate--tRNA ligase [Nitrospirae bacterium]|nr:glutamate--tRNA ligase [Nitrospirota bacterium]
MRDSVRVRFAPSPTGYLHIGGARTALFNWLFARHNKGVFVLRIEDTDRTRSTEEYIEAILDGMTWLGLDWDEGPFRQTERMDVYRRYIERLLDEGKAYYCYCSPEELEERRRAALKEGRPPKYDGRCRDLDSPPADRPPAVRFRMPRTGQTIVEDLIRGPVVYENEQLDDFIILRSDGSPTYNFVVVVDDVDMGITHVIRGDDHLNNTPKQIHIYRSLGFPVPEFAHLPMILGPDKTRLSKRHGATSVQAYRDMGYLPEALLNYLVRLGWSCGDQEVFTKEELIEKFSLEAIGKSAAVFNPDKLLWLNSQYIKDSPADYISELLVPFLQREGLVGEGEDIDREWLRRAVATLQERSRTLLEMARSMRYYMLEYVELDPRAKEKFVNEKTKPLLEDVRRGLAGVEDFSAGEIEKVFMSVVERHNTKLGKVAQPVRVAITGNTVSPGIFEVLEIVGKERVLKRLDRAIEGI